MVRIVWVLLFAASGLGAGCATAPVEEPVEGIPDFSLQTVDGQTRTLADFEASATLINFFFPT